MIILYYNVIVNNDVVKIYIIWVFLHDLFLQQHIYWEHVAVAVNSTNTVPGGSLYVCTNRIYRTSNRNWSLCYVLVPPSKEITFTWRNRRLPSPPQINSSVCPSVRLSEIFLKNGELTWIVTQVFFEMNSYT